MQQKISNAFNQHMNHFANSAKLDKKGEMQVIQIDQKDEKQLFNYLKKNSFFGLINIIGSTLAEGNTLGIAQPMPSTTDTNRQARNPEKAYLYPFQRFNCQQLNFDTCISYGKLDALLDYLDQDFEDALNMHTTQHMLLSLLLAGWHGEQRAPTSNPSQHPQGQDSAKGWLQKVRESAPNNLIHSAEIGENASHKDLHALIKANLAKLPANLRASGKLIALCGQNLLNDYQIDPSKLDLTLNSLQFVKVAQNTLGGLTAINVANFPENSLFITSLDNLSLYIHKGTIRRMMSNNSKRDRIEHYSSLSLDFIVENPNDCLLFENIQFS